MNKEFILTQIKKIEEEMDKLYYDWKRLKKVYLEFKQKINKEGK